MPRPPSAPLTPISSLPGIDWPAVTGPRASMLLALQYQLEQSQWWDPDQLRAQQWRQIQALLAHAGATVPYYRDLFRERALDPRRPLSPEEFGRLPPLTRARVQTCGDRLVSERIPPEHGDRIRLSTSGSTGRPVSVLKTRACQLIWNALTLRDHIWHRRDLRARLGAIRYFKDRAALPPEGRAGPAWGAATLGLFQTGPAFGLNILARIPEQAAWLAAREPAYLITYPSNLAALVRYSAQSGRRPRGLREVLTMGEVLDPEVRALCQGEWQAPVTDLYSSEEVGYIALQCPEHPHYHVQSESLLVEILDPAGRPCGPGEAGRVLVTDLHNFAMPLIRYEIGDYAEVGDSCPCGRGLPVLRRINGRARGMLCLPSGEHRWPVMGFQEGIDPGLIHQFQVVQLDLERIEIRLVVRRPLSAAEERAMIERVLERLGHPFSARIAYCDEIARSPSGKYEDFRSEVGDCPQRPR